MAFVWINFTSSGPYETPCHCLPRHIYLRYCCCCPAALPVSSSTPPLATPQQDNFLASFLLGWGITIGAGLASYPIDTVRRRMMMTSGQAVKYKSSIDCFQQVCTAGQQQLGRAVDDGCRTAGGWAVCVGCRTVAWAGAVCDGCSSMGTK
jgi:hypothetical protein